ncbi:molybdenum cofactor biosynthesis protein MoaE [Ornithinicoccus halotolerans]|uniref:molybdenum cofactor biosynthesis protein MoaE n=1 Tax=Ornithinicoccus halotolerans TaxID=1748220 RepID=UPI001297226C|nr:molybdenum cofactor biosynthesis protein MoaE [Ornithinicoccus halotolerans]
MPSEGTPSALITGEELSLDAAVAAVRDPRAGAVVVFAGVVRDHDGGRDGVVQLDYSAHPSAPETLAGLVARVAGQDGVIGAAAHHRSGTLRVGDLAVVCAVSAAHRAAAFEACRELIEELKQQVPIWKEQRFADGTLEWVGL